MKKVMQRVVRANSDQCLEYVSNSASLHLSQGPHHPEDSADRFCLGGASSCHPPLDGLTPWPS